MPSPKAKRGIVRAAVTLPLLLCTLGWAWSYFYTERVSYHGAGRERSVQIGVGDGVLWSGPNASAVRGWRYTHTHPDWEVGELHTGLPHWRFLGVHFFYGTHPYAPGGTTLLLVVPLWMLCVAAGLAPAWLWLNTRKRPNARGFVVEGPHAKT